MKSHLHDSLSETLLSRLSYIRIFPKKILCTSVENTYTPQHLKLLYPEAKVIHVLPQQLENCSEKNVDLIVALFSFELTKHPKAMLIKLHELLKIQGLLLFSTLGPDSYQKNNFIDMHHIGDWMKELHFLDPVVDREEVELQYEDFSLLQSEARTFGIIISNDYKNEPVPYSASLELIFGHGWKQPSRDEILISLDSIKKNK